MLENKDNIPLSLAVMFAHDEYPAPRENVISATTLLKPIREIILGMRVPQNTKTSGDISSRVSSVLGTAVHNQLEAAWKSEALPDTLLSLGYPEGMVKNVVVNPSDSVDLDECIPVYTEFRTEKEIMGWTISGEFDFVADGRLRDLKSTGVFTWINSTNDEKYKWQGSIYRWLNPEKITDDIMAIDFIFMDWNGLSAKTQKVYPPMRVMEQTYQLHPIDVTEQFIKGKLTTINALRYAEQHLLPRCNNNDLWVGPSSFKYYKNPENVARATRVYDNPTEAYAHQARDGGHGIVLEVKDPIKACKYCSALSVCEQANEYVNSGELKL